MADDETKATVQVRCPRYGADFGRVTLDAQLTCGACTLVFTPDAGYGLPRP